MDETRKTNGSDVIRYFACGYFPDMLKILFEPMVKTYSSQLTSLKENIDAQAFSASRSFAAGTGIRVFS
jgi:hypothetical protein